MAHDIRVCGPWLLGDVTHPDRECRVVEQAAHFRAAGNQKGKEEYTDPNTAFKGLPWNGQKALSLLNSHCLSGPS